MQKSNHFPPEVRERAVRMVQEHRGEYPSLWAELGAACIRAIAVLTKSETCFGDDLDGASDSVDEAAVERLVAGLRG